MRDGNPAGQAGRGLCLPGQDGAPQSPGVTGATRGREKAGQSLDHGLLVRAGIDIQ